MPEPETRVLSFPPGGPVVRIWTEPGIRVSRCRACASPIPGGDQRVAIEVTTQRGNQYRKSTYYVHSSCLANLDDKTLPVGAVGWCVDCGRSVPKPLGGGESPFSFAVAKDARAWLCWDCGLKPSYRVCDFCGLLHPRHRVSMIDWRSVQIGTLLRNRRGDFCCEWCSEVDALPTVKDRRRRERADALLDTRYGKILDKIAENRMFE